MATTKLEQRACVLRRVLDPVTNAESLSTGQPGIRPIDPRAEVRSFLIRSTVAASDAAFGSRSSQSAYWDRTVGPENKNTIARKKAKAKRSIVHMALPRLIVTCWTRRDIGERQKFSRTLNCEL
jgi:hypothetical protein